MEDYLACEIKQGKRNLADVQTGVAEDWTQYLGEAKAAGFPKKCEW